METQKKKYAVRLEEGCYDKKYSNLVFETNTRSLALKAVKGNNKLYATSQYSVIAYWSESNGIIRDGRKTGNMCGELVFNMGD